MVVKWAATFDLSPWRCALFRNSGCRCNSACVVFSGQNLNIDVVSAVFVYQNTDLHVNYIKFLNLGSGTHNLAELWVFRHSFVGCLVSMPPSWFHVRRTRRRPSMDTRSVGCTCFNIIFNMWTERKINKINN